MPRYLQRLLAFALFFLGTIAGGFADIVAIENVTVKTSAVGAFATVTTQYDAVGNATHVTNPHGRTTQTEYDALNRPVKVLYPDNTYTTAEYAATGLVVKTTNELGAATETVYDPAGRPPGSAGDRFFCEAPARRNSRCRK